MKKAIFITLVAMLFSSVGNSQVTIPYRFKSGEPAIADQVNANFSTIESILKKLSLDLETLNQQVQDVRSNELTDKIAPLSQLTGQLNTFNQELQSLRSKNSRLETALDQIRQSTTPTVSVSGKAGVSGKSPGSGSGVHGVYGETDGDWGWASGVYGKASKTNAIGVTGWNDGGGTGVYGYSKNGKAVVASSETGDFIDATGGSPRVRRFVVKNNGEVWASGRFTSGGSDVAEILPATEGLKPSDVLVVGRDGRLRRSEGPFATNVVGVYSTNPGFVGGDDRSNDLTQKAILAVLGVVPVKASAENGPIRPGMLLVTAKTPGHAMCSGDNPPVGTVIGKALESLDYGTGTIKMLVILH
jgi:hypothetical protein